MQFYAFWFLWWSILFSSPVLSYLLFVSTSTFSWLFALFRFHLRWDFLQEAFLPNVANENPLQVATDHDSQFPA
jgi:hypothetical protein